MICMCAQTLPAQSEKINQEQCAFFLEEIAQRIHAPYFRFYISITVIIEILRIMVDYVTVVEQLHLSMKDLVALWRDDWLVFLWPVCMVLMYYSMKYLRNYTLRTVDKINPRLKESPTCTLKEVFHGRFQHLLPICFLIICILYFAIMWLDNCDVRPSLGFRATSAAQAIPIREIPLKFAHAALWITYNWIIGAYFSWICIGTIVVAYVASRLVDNIEVFHHDRCGGLSPVGSLAMKTSLLYILSVSFMFPGWIARVTISRTPDPIGLPLQIGALSCLVAMELGIFLLPMMFFHPSLNKAKEEELANLDKRIVNHRYSLTKDATSEEDDRRFESTVTFRQMAQSMYGYPFSYGMLAKVITSASTPFLTAAIPKVIEQMLHTPKP